MNFYARQQKSNLAVASRNDQVLRAINQSVTDIGRRFTTVKGQRFAKIMTDQLTELHDVLVQDIKSGIKEQWMLSNTNTNVNLEGYFRNVKVSDELYKSFRTPNLGAMNAFMDRVDNGMNLSKRVWNFTNGVQAEMEGILQAGVLSGKSAAKISRELNGFVNGNPIRYGGKLIAGKNLVYQAIRVASSEMNMAYRTASYLQNSRLPFVTSVTVHLSAAHPDLDICDDMAGVYPRGFEFIGWHPFCYSSDTEVYTSEGWKFFKDVSGTEQVLSLNPNTKDVEWTGIAKRVKHNYAGKMLRFFNRALDMLVTPDHKMVGFDKTSGKLRESTAQQFYDKMYPVTGRNVYSTNSCLYRTSEWSGIDRESESIGNVVVPIGLYCEFMGYYLSEGSTSRKYAVTVSQDSAKNKEKYETIYACLEKLPFKVTRAKTGFNIYDKALWEHVKPYGKSFDKYVPDVIKTLPKEDIAVFLRAYCLGDGSVRKTKGWKNAKFLDEISYSTSSKRMAEDIGEMILKTGSHPSFSINPKGRSTEFKNGTYISNNDQHIVRECRSQYANQFNREEVEYSGDVYDVELEKNHILYTRRNGKCVWGSNCICFSTYNTITPEEFGEYMNTGTISAKGFKKGLPPRAARYVQENGARFLKYKNPPYWLADNFTQDLKLRKFVASSVVPKEPPVLMAPKKKK